MRELSDDELLAELGIAAEEPETGAQSHREQRIVAGFEDILRFVETHGREPRHGENRDIFERLYAVRLESLRSLPEARDLLSPLDSRGLLSAAPPQQPQGDDELLSELGVSTPAGEDITVLRHVGSSEDRRAAEEIANRIACKEFERFKPLFDEIESSLKAGLSESRPFERDASIEPGDFFILGGLFALVAETGEIVRNAHGRPDARLRVIYSNGTESNLLLRSLQRALYKDETGRRVVKAADALPLFSAQWEPDDIESGTIYVLRSLSAHPFISEHRKLVHKIGVTGGSVESRIANARLDATYLLADVEIVATYKLASVNRTKLEALFHRLFSPAQLELSIHDRFGNLVRPREWFVVPLQAIDEAVRRILDGSIVDFTYDRNTARLVPVST